MKKLVFIASLLSTTLVFIGCGPDKKIINVKNDSKPVDSFDNVKDSLSTNSVIASKTENEIDLNDYNKSLENSKEIDSNISVESHADDSMEFTFNYYYYDVIDDEIKTEEISSSCVDKEFILQLLKDKDVLSKDVTINKLDKKGKTTVLDFNSAFINTELSSDIEANTLDAIAKTFMDGLKLNKLKITVDGKDYQSNNLILESDYYFTK